MPIPRTPSRKPPLSPAREKLVDLIHRLRFGRITSFEVRDGDPVLGEESRVVAEIHLGKGDSDDSAASTPADSNHSRKRHFVELFEVFDRIGSGRIEFLDVSHGLPFRMQIEKEASL